MADVHYFYVKSQGEGEGIMADVHYFYVKSQVKPAREMQNQRGFQNCSGDKMSGVEDFQAKNTSSPVIEGHSALSPGGEHICKSCHGKWSCCGEKCYYFSQEQKTWHDSKKACEGIGASLVKIDSKEEQEHIQSQVGYISWVGLYKKGDMYPWTWLDGSRPSQKL
ncbi:CD209 antigen-like protein A [Tupaia chinensis]|uniref:CD209 antigen-like protein A n=1 Tax=Tupaia chinensis TaxID=246437 RepID=UPI000FFB67BB|nr:CD209 antigen-like protein A [Tupaia chinensis]